MSLAVAELRAAGRVYGQATVLRDVDLRIAAGEIVGIGGGSGSGKSTLLRLLGALEPPDAGQALLGGQRAWAVRRRRPRRRVPRHHAARRD